MPKGKPIRTSLREKNKDKKAAEEIFSQLSVAMRNNKVAIITDSAHLHDLTQEFRERFNERYAYVMAALQAGDKECDSQGIFTDEIIAALGGYQNISYFSEENAKFYIQQAKTTPDLNKKRNAASGLVQSLGWNLATVLALATYGLTAPYAYALVHFENKAAVVQRVVESLSERLMAVGFNVKALHSRMATVAARFEAQYILFERHLKNNPGAQRTHYNFFEQAEGRNQLVKKYLAFLQKLAGFSK